MRGALMDRSDDIDDMKLLYKLADFEDELTFLMAAWHKHLPQAVNDKAQELFDAIDKERDNL